MFAIVFGVLAVLGVLAVEYAAVAFMNFSILNLVLYVIPIGGVIYGCVIGYLISKGLRISGKQLSIKMLLFTFLLGLATVPAMFYVEYKTTYIDSNGEYNRVFEGDPISEFEYDSEGNGNYKDFDYVTYIKFVMENTDYSLSIKSSSIDLATAGTINYIILLIQTLSVAFMAPLILKVAISDEKYCENCRAYYKKKNLFKFGPVNYETFMSKINEAAEYSTSLTSLRGNSEKYTSEYFEVTLAYCTKCNKGELQVKHYLKHGKNMEESKEDIKVIPVQNAPGILR